MKKKKHLLTFLRHCKWFYFFFILVCLDISLPAVIPFQSFLSSINLDCISFYFYLQSRIDEGKNNEKELWAFNRAKPKIGSCLLIEADQLARLCERERSWAPFIRERKTRRPAKWTLTLSSHERSHGRKLTQFLWAKIGTSLFSKGADSWLRPQKASVHESRVDFFFLSKENSRQHIIKKKEDLNAVWMEFSSIGKEKETLDSSFFLNNFFFHTFFSF